MGFRFQDILKRNILLLIICNVGGCSKPCSSNYFQNIKTNVIYNFSKNYITRSLGISIDVDMTLYNDQSLFLLDMDTLDERIRKMEECVKTVFQEEIKIFSSLQILNKYQCIYVPQPVNITHNCIKIKIVKPIFSNCSDWQFIDAYAPNQLCENKGLIPSMDCPCRWRSAIQDNFILITPPQLYLWDLIRIMTSCNNIWVAPLSKCAIL